MPRSKYVRLLIDRQEVEVSNIDQIPIAISYALEDRENFQRKEGSKAVNIIVPATVANDKIFNTYHNPGIEDLTSGEIFKGNRLGALEVNGQELLVGKAFMKGATHTDKPESYELNLYGDNSDWVIDLKERTLYEDVKDILFYFTKAEIVNSWTYDGTDKFKPYVFAPVRYGQPMDSFQDLATNNTISDFSMGPEYMKPSISKYWIIYKAFKSLGYTVESEFMDSEYFRRQVMPWTWGNFLSSDGTRLDSLKFLAKSSEQVHKLNTDFTGIWDVKADNDSINGGYDNTNTYTYNSGTGEMTWTYPALSTFGPLSATFHLLVYVDAIATANSDVELRAQWFKNGSKVNHGNDNGNGTLLLDLDAPAIGERARIENIHDWATFDVSPGDVISCKLYLHTNDTAAGRARIHASVDAFEIDYFRIPLGGLINFENYLGFKKFKFLDFFSGVIDEFNLCFRTDSVNKVIYIEPEHAYSTVHDQSVKQTGYFNGKMLDWSAKQDLSKTSRMALFDEYDRELIFKYKDDSNDGSNNIVANRNLNKPALAKYVLPDRFKDTKSEIENRFFSVVQHYEVIQWRGITGEEPQMVCLLPENISNTSRDESQNTFVPKSCYYKGMAPYGWMFDGQQEFSFPYMFAVNYKEGGEEDPILSYCDEQIGDTPVIGKGLLRRFYAQKLENIRNGQYYMTWMHLNNNDVANFRHREHVVVRGQKWEVMEIIAYKPLLDESTQVYLRKWSPIRS